MRRIISYFLAFLLVGLTGCSTTEKISLSAPDGTKIYAPNYTSSPIVTTSGSGFSKTELPSDMYCGYLIARTPGVPLDIPVGLNYRTRRHHGAKAALGAGLTLSVAGLGAMVGGLIPLIVGAQSTGCVIIGAGAGASLIGIGFGMPAQSRLRQTAYDYNFGYAKKQTIIIPNLSTALLNPNPLKGMPAASAGIKTDRKKASSGKDVTVSPLSNATKASKSRGDVAKRISGNYSGSGTLFLGNNVDERYPSVNIILERKDKNHVAVRVIESDEDFFDSLLIYTITTNKKGDYELVIDNLPEATISITKNGVLSFKHGKVNIDNQIYSLNISATKSN